MLEKSMLNYELANKPLETGMIPPNYNKYYESIYPLFKVDKNKSNNI